MNIKEKCTQGQLQIEIVKKPKHKYRAVSVLKPLAVKLSTINMTPVSNSLFTNSFENVNVLTPIQYSKFSSASPLLMIREKNRRNTVSIHPLMLPLNVDATLNTPRKREAPKIAYLSKLKKRMRISTAIVQFPMLNRSCDAEAMKHKIRTEVIDSSHQSIYVPKQRYRLFIEDLKVQRMSKDKVLEGIIAKKRNSRMNKNAHIE